MADEQELNTQELTDQDQELSQEKAEEVQELNNEDILQFENAIKVRHDINSLYTGYVYDMKENSAKTRFHTTRDMAYDSDGLVFNSFLHTAANYAAQVAINSEFIITIGSRVSFLAPAKVGDTISFEASAFFNESKKREVKVTGFINDIRVFEGSFQLIILEEHIFKIQKKQMEKQAKDSRDQRAAEAKAKGNA